MWTSPITQSKFPDRFFTHQNPLLWILYRKPTITDANNYWWPVDYQGKKRAINRQFSAIKYDEKFEYNLYLCFVRNHSHMLFVWNKLLCFAILEYCCSICCKQQSKHVWGSVNLGMTDKIAFLEKSYLPKCVYQCHVFVRKRFYFQNKTQQQFRLVMSNGIWDDWFCISNNNGKNAIFLAMRIWLESGISWFSWSCSSLRTCTYLFGCVVVLAFGNFQAVWYT